MPVSTDNIRRWIEQSDIDYISQFIKTWIPFNAWYNAEYATLNSDREKINSIKNNSNTIRNKINTLLERDGQESQEFKSYLASLHSELQDIHIESKEGRIWFNDIVKSRNPDNLINNEIIRSITYFLQRTDGGRLGNVSRFQIYLKDRNNTTFFTYVHSTYDINHLYLVPDFQSLSNTQKENTRLFFEQLKPIIVTDTVEIHLENSPVNHYKCDSFNFKRDYTDAHCPSHIVCKCLIEILYQLRNVLFHGELTPNAQSQRVYKNAYFCMKYLLNSLR